MLPSSSHGDVCSSRTAQPPPAAPAGEGEGAAGRVRRQPLPARCAPGADGAAPGGRRRAGSGAAGARAVGGGARCAHLPQRPTRMHAGVLMLAAVGGSCAQSVALRLLDSGCCQVAEVRCWLRSPTARALPHACGPPHPPAGSCRPAGERSRNRSVPPVCRHRARSAPRPPGAARGARCAAAGALLRGAHERAVDWAGDQGAGHVRVLLQARWRRRGAQHQPDGDGAAG